MRLTVVIVEPQGDMHSPGTCQGVRGHAPRRFLKKGMPETIRIMRQGRQNL